MNAQNEIALNTFHKDICTRYSLFGKYYYVFNDTLFHLDVRVSFDSERDRYGVWGKVFHYDENNECHRFDMEDRIKKYLKVRSFEGLVQASIDVVDYEGEYFYNELMKIKGSRESLSLEEWKNLHVESYVTKQDKKDFIGDLSWNWQAVAQSGCETERRRRITETCPDCGSHLIAVFVSSPAWTWQNLCGREGMLTFCPQCQRQIRFHLECMN